MMGSQRSTTRYIVIWAVEFTRNGGLPYAL
jgi:hypothetical protein